MKFWPALVAIILSGCGRYSSFTLPAQPGGDPGLTFSFDIQPSPVMIPEQPWESHDVLNPSVVEAGSWINLYSGYDGRTWRTGLATSPDGVRWSKSGMVLQPDPGTWEAGYIAANGAALFHDRRLWYWYVAGAREHPRIGLWRMEGDPGSPGAAARKESRPVLETGPYASWDEIAVADPYAIRMGEYFYLYYLGQDRARRQRIGVARSTDGVRWQKLVSNPLLELGEPGSFDEAGLGEPAVWNSHGFYWMLYTGRDVTENRRLGLARSTDGVHWKKLPVVFAGNQPWNSKVVCDPTVHVDGPTIRVWFGGGDVASPDENLHGRIGIAVLRPVNATVGK